MKTCPSCSAAVEDHLSTCTCGHKFESGLPDERSSKGKVRAKGSASDYWGIYVGAFTVLLIQHFIAHDSWAGLIPYAAQALGGAVIPFLFLGFMSRKAGWVAFAVLAFIWISTTALEQFHRSNLGTN